MTQRISNTDLERLVNRLNKLTGHELEPRSPKGRNIGTYMISGAYGGVKLEQIDKDGGVRTISNDGYGTKKQLYAFLLAFISGIEAGKTTA